MRRRRFQQTNSRGVTVSRKIETGEDGPIAIFTAAAQGSDAMNEAMPWEKLVCRFGWVARRLWARHRPLRPLPSRFGRRTLNHEARDAPYVGPSPIPLKT
jgi:hypothetical protein